MSAYSASRVRRSLIVFSIGKGLGIFFGLGLLLTLVRALSIEAYGFYLISQALLVIVNQFSSFGFEPTVQRFLPELLSLSEGRTLHKLTIKLCVWRFVSFVLIALILYPFTELLVDTLQLNGMLPEMRLFLIVIVFELFARFLDLVFDSFLLQGISQVSMLLRSGLRLIPVVWLSFTAPNGDIELETWILIEIIAAIVGCIWGIVKLWQYLRITAKQSPGKDVAIEYERYRKYAIPIYLAGSVGILSGRDMVKIIAARILPNIEFASFGFAMNFAAMLHRYLPMTLLIGMIRPIFVAARQREDYITRLPMMASLLFKLNLFMLVPVIIFLSVYSEQVSILLTAGKYPEAGNFIIAFMPVLIIQTLRGIVNLIALAMENARAQLVATILSLFGLLVGVLSSDILGAYGFFIGLVLSGLVYSIWVIRELKHYKLDYNIKWRGYIKLILSAMATTVISIYFKDIIDIDKSIALIFLAAQTMGVFLIFSFFLKPFSDLERNTVNNLLKRKVFVW
jgi:O-antigen/teichoic acid export membrane protein